RYPGARGVQKTDNRIHWSHKTGQILIERQGTEVVMIEGVRKAALNQVLAQAWKSTKTEHTGGLPKNLKPYPWPKKKKSEPTPPSVTEATGFRYEVPGSWREAKIRNDRFPIVLTSKRGDAEIRIATLETDQKAPTFTRKMLVRLPRHLDGFKRISLRRAEVGDRKASILDYAGQSRDSGGPHRYRQVIYRDGEKLYVLTFVAPETAFSRHIKAFERFLDSVSH
ncbi:MAG: hypothetical protein QF752_14235, partial [Planctomycetota bacterium]|nr:hypothetical protein [Planctomycetota bacterium]